MGAATASGAGGGCKPAPRMVGPTTGDTHAECRQLFSDSAHPIRAPVA